MLKGLDPLLSPELLHALAAILSVLPLDTFTDTTAAVMAR